jgi:Xaa-Pro aminopeptidase
MNSGSNTNNNEKGVEVRTHDIPVADAMTEFMKEGWAPSPLTGITAHPSIPYTKLRRDNLTKFIYFKFRINAQPKLQSP